MLLLEKETHLRHTTRVCWFIQGCGQYEAAGNIYILSNLLMRSFEDFFAMS